MESSRGVSLGVNFGRLLCAPHPLHGHHHLMTPRLTRNIFLTDEKHANIDGSIRWSGEKLIIHIDCRGKPYSNVLPTYCMEYHASNMITVAYKEVTNCSCFHGVTISITFPCLDNRVFNDLYEYPPRSANML